MPEGAYPNSVNCPLKDLTTVTSRCCESGRTICCVVGWPVGVQALSGTAPVSQINVPLGCATRKHATDISVVASSPLLNLKRSGSAMSACADVSRLGDHHDF